MRISNPATNFQGAVPATANNGLLSVGPGPWDGASAGHFVGNVAGTALAANFASGYSGDHIRTQIQGVDVFRVDSVSGLHVAMPSGTNAGGAINVPSGMSPGANYGGIANVADGGDLYITPILNGGLIIGSGTAARIPGPMDVRRPLLIDPQSFTPVTAVPLTVQGVAGQTADLMRLEDNATNPQLAVMNAGTGAAPIWALRVRAIANAESMAQAHVVGAATGRAIQVFDDAGVSLGWLNLTA
ncbi:MAG: hypothetical protein ACYDHY_17385 [Acidiferrobacterales bacterium]